MSGAAVTTGGRLSLMLTELRLPTIKRLAADLCTQSDREGWPGHRLLEALLEHEMAEREARRMDRHRAESALSPDKRLSSFDFAAVPSVSKAQVTALAEGTEWLDRGANVLLFGPPGVGKSHLVCALGHALIEAGRRVLFTRCGDLVQRLQAARRDLRLPQEPGHHPPADPPIGRVFRRTPDGELTVIASGLQYPNGIALEPDGGIVIVDRGGLHRVLPDGTTEVVVEVIGTSGGDGFCVDTEGNFYCATVMEHGVRVFAPDGKEIDQLGDPGARRRLRPDDELLLRRRRRLHALRDRQHPRPGGCVGGPAARGPRGLPLARRLTRTQRLRSRRLANATIVSNSASVNGSTESRLPFASRRQFASSGSVRSSSSETKGSARTGATVTQSQRGSSGLLAGS